MNKLTKMVNYIFIDGITAKNAAKVSYIHVSKNHDIVQFIIFDWSRTFVNHLWEQLITKFGIKKTFPRVTTHKLMDKRKYWIPFSNNIIGPTLIFLQNDWASW